MLEKARARTQKERTECATYELTVCRKTRTKVYLTSKILYKGIQLAFTIVLYTFVWSDLTIRAMRKARLDLHRALAVPFFNLTQVEIQQRY